MNVPLALAVAVPVSSLAVGLLIGWLIRGGRNARGVSEADWRIRLEARDRDLRQAQDRLSALVHTTGSFDEIMSAADRLVALEEEIDRSNEELDRLRALGVDREPATGSMARRLEELEVELATLASMACPDPVAHRRERVERT